MTQPHTPTPTTNPPLPDGVAHQRESMSGAPRGNTDSANAVSATRADLTEGGHTAEIVAETQSSRVTKATRGRNHNLMLRRPGVRPEDLVGKLAAYLVGLAT